jgi:hypothetical protein
MRRPLEDFRAIARHRSRIETELADLIAQTGNDATIDAIKALIYHEDGEGSFFTNYTVFMTELFGDDDAVIATIQDAWNYFPHDRLGGRCPAEVITELSSG